MSFATQFVIYAPSFDENSGGCIALHKLCSVLNAKGRQAFLFPEVLPAADMAKMLRARGPEDYDRLVERHFKLGPGLATPVLSARAVNEIRDSDCTVVVYPEVTDGNPIGGTKVVRWLLHDLGFHTGRISLGRGDLLLRYNALRKAVSVPGCRMGSTLLQINHVPFDKYNLEGVASQREGVAFCIRKGKGKPMIHPQESAVLVDGMSHGQIAAVFKRVKAFYSYDTATLFSRLAVLCGCPSVVVPDQGVSMDQWCSDPDLQTGLTYGFCPEPLTNETIRRVEAILREWDSQSSGRVDDFIDEVEQHFFGVGTALH